jgi:Zn-dependent oligopeptidase
MFGIRRGGAWMDDCVGRSGVFDTLPVAYLVCNFSPPVEGKPSLMTFREVSEMHSCRHAIWLVAIRCCMLHASIRSFVSL